MADMKVKCLVCPICCEDGEGRRFIACSHCAMEACGECVGRFVCGQLKEPCCMRCGKVWSREFVMERGQKAWVKGEFIPHMGRLLLEQEKALLPGAQGEAALVREIRELSAELKAVPTVAKLERLLRKDPEGLASGLAEARQRRQELKDAMNELKSRSIVHDGGGKKPPKEETKKGRAYLFRCPVESCRGFVSDEFTCGTCQGTVCKKCHVPLSAGRHSCKKEDVKTARLVIDETKPCPKCMTLTFKASGCNQMFCTQCHAVWDWVSGELDTRGVVHNPHYFDLLAKNPEMRRLEVERVACGEIPEFVDYYFYVQTTGASVGVQRSLMELYRLRNHMHDVVLREINWDRVKDNFDLRVQFLLNEIDEAGWASKLLHRERRRMKLRALWELADMAVMVFEDLIKQVAATVRTADKAETLAGQFREMCEYYDEALDRIVQVHGGSVPAVARLNATVW